VQAQRARSSNEGCFEGIRIQLGSLAMQLNTQLKTAPCNSNERCIRATAGASRTALRCLFAGQRGQLALTSVLLVRNSGDVRVARVHCGVYLFCVLMLALSVRPKQALLQQAQHLSQAVNKLELVVLSRSVLTFA
jgi:hypothetical protein